MEIKKTSEHLIDPELYAAATLFGDPGDPAEGYLQSRENIKMFFSNLTVDEKKVVTEEVWIDNLYDDSKVRLFIVKPKECTDSPRPLFYNIHGGGMILGIPEMDLDLFSDLSGNHNFVCVSPDYRLAPEYHQPAQLHDMYSGIKWCVDHAKELNIDTGRIAVAGSSAGSGLAGGLALYIRDQKEFAIHHLRLALPMLDDRTGVRETHPYNGQYVFKKEGDYFGWKVILNQEPGSEGVSEYYCPARAKSLAGLPNTYLSIGSIELFADEALDFAKQLMYDGVTVELHVYPGWHHNAPLVKTAYYPQLEQKNTLNALLRALKLEQWSEK